MDIEMLNPRPIWMRTQACIVRETPDGVYCDLDDLKPMSINVRAVCSLVENQTKDDGLVTILGASGLFYLIKLSKAGVEALIEAAFDKEDKRIKVRSRGF